MEKNEQSQIAGKQYAPSDEEASSFFASAFASALAETHEQVSDVYAEGTVEAVIDNAGGKDIPLSRERKQ
ncbi:YozQ family protein [Saccharococcus thermophilus]|nr:YozQ family protein [Saccharococcus thermophilus]